MTKTWCNMKFRVTWKTVLLLGKDILRLASKARPWRRWSIGSPTIVYAALEIFDPEEFSLE